MKKTTTKNQNISQMLGKKVRVALNSMEMNNFVNLKDEHYKTLRMMIQQPQFTG